MATRDFAFECSDPRLQLEFRQRRYIFAQDNAGRLFAGQQFFWIDRHGLLFLTWKA